MDEEPTGAPDPEGDDGDNAADHLLVVGLRIALIAFLVILGVVVVGKAAVSRLHLHDGGSDFTSLGGPVPVSPIAQDTASASPTPYGNSDGSTSSSDLPTLNAPPAATDIPPIAAIPQGLILRVDPPTVSSGQSFNVSGTYAGRDGVALRLQRLEDGIWADYPNEITVTMGSYSAIADSTMSGTNSFRVYDQTTDRASNVVSILVR